MDNSAVFSEDHKRVNTKFLGVVFLYMFLGLAITALTAFLYALTLAKLYPDPNTLSQLSEQGQNVLFVSVIVAMIIAIIDSIAMPFISRKSGMAPWFGYILYALCIGVALSVVLLAGVSYALIGEAFGITSLIFLVMAAIGAFSKANLTPLAFVGLALLLGIMMVSTFWLIFMAFNGWGGYYLYYYAVSVGIVVVMMLFIAYDVNRMVAIADQGITTNNVALYCAFSLYGDFISLFLRILMILMSARRN
jgi:uncharacterized protein